LWPWLIFDVLAGAQTLVEELLFLELRQAHSCSQGLILLKNKPILPMTKVHFVDGKVEAAIQQSLQVLEAQLSG
jgi:hypothetical protein